MSDSINLIVGLCNPGENYAATRHNAGAWLVQQLGDQSSAPWRLEKKFHGLYTTIEIKKQVCHLLLPNTFMNHSGQAISAVSNYFKLDPKTILVAHDELDLAPGDVRLKVGGGHGGHNGLRDTIAHLNTPDFIRLRIGIGHPGQAKDVIDYVLKRPSQHDRMLIDTAIQNALTVLPDAVLGNVQAAMKALHTKN